MGLDKPCFGSFLSFLGADVLYHDIRARERIRTQIFRLCTNEPDVEHRLIMVPQRELVERRSSGKPSPAQLWITSLLAPLPLVQSIIFGIPAHAVKHSLFADSVYNARRQGPERVNPSAEHVASTRH